MRAGVVNRNLAVVKPVSQALNVEDDRRDTASKDWTHVHAPIPPETAEIAIVDIDRLVQEAIEARGELSGTGCPGVP